MRALQIVLVVGNPRTASRTREAGERLAAGLTTEPVRVLELAELGPKLLGWGDPEVMAAVVAVQAADVAIIASPTYKASYTGLLKLFLEQFAGGTGLQGVVAIPLMLSADPRHALAAEHTLRPVLDEIGATQPTAPLHLIEATYREDGAIAAWLERWAPVVRRQFE